MKEVEVVAKSKGKVVATGKAIQFDNLREAATKLGGEEKALAIINERMRIRKLDELRRVSGPPSLTKLLRSLPDDLKAEVMKMVEARMTQKGAGA